ncbi:MAG TPA: hypothetical protein H9998_05640, partial [Candidatus Ruthenibacterium merdipullorum]|nr:hypothetical protein [Candidatus Ruthenibacterium merdipullorum]
FGCVRLSCALQIGETGISIFMEQKGHRPRKKPASRAGSHATARLWREITYFPWHFAAWVLS